MLIQIGAAPNNGLYDDGYEEIKNAILNGTGLVRNIEGDGTIDNPRTNIPGLALAQQLAAIKNRELQRSIASEAQPQDIETLNTLMPITGSGTVNDPTTNIRGLGELQRSLAGLDKVQRSIAYEAQPQDAMTFSNKGDWLEQLGEWKVGDVEVGRRIGNDLLGFTQTFNRGIFNVGGTALLGAGKLSEYLLGGESYVKKIGKKSLNLDQEFKKAAQQAYYDVNHGNIDELADYWHGAGTTQAFILLQLIASLAGKGMSPFLSYTIGRPIRNLQESLFEAGNAVSDLYAIDPNREGDALRGGLYSMIGNSPLDKLQEIAEGHIVDPLLQWGANTILPKDGVIASLVKNYGVELLKQVINELPQETRQQITEQAVINTFKSGDMSFSNFWRNYWGEMSKFGEYFEQVAPSVMGSTFISHNLMWPLGIAGGAYRTNRYNRDMRAKVPEATSNLENSRTNLGQQRTTLLNNADNLDKQRSAILNDAYNLEQQADALRNNASNTSPSDVGLGVNSANEEMDTNPDYQYDDQTADDVPILSRVETLSRAEDMRSKAQSMRSQAEDMRSQAETMRSQAEASLSQAKTLDEQLKILKEYAESKPSWWEADAPVELYDALGKGEAISLFADDEGLKEDSTPETSSSAEEPTTQRLVDDEPDIDLDEAKAQPNATTQQATQADAMLSVGEQQATQEPTVEQNDTQLLPPSAQQNDDISSPFDSLNTASDTNQNIVDDAEGESYHQSTQGTQANINAGEFTFSTKGKSYTFGVASTHSNDTGSTGIATDRRMRYQGRRLEITNSRGQVIATYHPYTGRFTFTPDMEKKHSSRWRNSFKSQFMSNANGYLKRGGFLDANGNLVSDGNEAFRGRWNKRRKSDANSFYDDVAYPEDAYDTQQPKGSILDSIRRAVKGDIYHQGDNQSENVADTSQSDSIDANTFSVDTSNGRYSFKVRASEFSDKHPTHKKFFGRFLELVDNAGNVIARYSPYTAKYAPYVKSFEFSKYAPKDKTTRQAIMNKLDSANNLNMALINNGFIDKNGNLIDDGNNEFRQERVGRSLEAGDIADYMRAEKAWREHRAKMSFGERLKEDLWDSTVKNVKDIPSNLKLRVQSTWDRGKLGVARLAGAGRSVVYRAIQLMADRLESDEGRELRKYFRDKLQDAGVFNKETRDALSRVMTSSFMNLASSANTTAQKLLNNYYFDINADLTLTGGFERTKSGNYQESRGTYRAIEANEPDHYGNVANHARNIIYLYRGHNVSTMIHEPAHFYLKVMHDLYRQGALTGRALQNWKALVKYLGLEGVDLTKSITELKKSDPEGYRKWHDAQEKYATSAEKYVMTGKAPKLKLARAFEVLKRYMSDVYASVGTIERGYFGEPLRHDKNGKARVTTVDDVIKYADMDDQEHEYTMSDEAMELMRLLYSDTGKHSKHTAKTSSSTESASGAGETYHQSSLGRQKTIRDVLDIMQTEQGRKNAGNVWVDYARVSQEEGERISEATGLDINDRYTHSIIGSAITHTLNRHGVGNEQRQDQLPITEADFEHIPYIIQNADEIRLGTDKTTGNLNDTIVYQKRINGHVLIVEEVRRGRKKLAFHTMRKARAGYIYDLSLEGQPIVKENAKSEGVNVRNGLTPEVQLPNALSNIRSVHGDNSIVNDNNTDTYHQTFMRADNFTYNGNLTPEARKQMDAIRDKYYGTAQWLKAPNGQKTKLTERQWLAVRTENFKRWFGDWENDPEHASKVLDENGEPMIVYHGTFLSRTPDHQGFSIFYRMSHFGANIEQALDRIGFYHNQEDWEDTSLEELEDRARNNEAVIMRVFLNIRNPLVIDRDLGDWTQDMFKRHGLSIDGHDGVFYDNWFEGKDDDNNPAFIAFIPNQVKSATNNNGEYLPTDPDHYHQIIGIGGARRLDTQEGSSERMQKLRTAIRMENDGVDASQIWKKTLWMRAKDGEWRTEIPDGQLIKDGILKLWKNDSRLQKLQYKQKNNPNYVYTPEEQKKLERLEAHPRTLSSIYDAPELYYAYPEIANAPLFFADLGEETVAETTDDGMIAVNLNVKSAQKIRTALIHEIQHLIQDTEGFAQGSGSDTNEDTQFLRAKQDYDDALIGLNDSSRQKVLDVLDVNGARWNVSSAFARLLLSSKEFKAYKKAQQAMHIMDSRKNELQYSYSHSAGEVEARNAEARADLGYVRRHLTPLDEMEDTPRDKQIVSRLPKKSEYSRMFFEEAERYYQIAPKRKQEYDALLVRKRPDLTPEQRTAAIAYIEKLGEATKQRRSQNNNPKLENAAARWLAEGHIRLPQDGYKIARAIAICEQQHINPMEFSDPNEILIKYTFKPTAASKRINPASVREFNNPVEYDNGITVYNVKDTQAGQEAVRRIIDTHWGEDAEPWCLTSRTGGNLDMAWDYWKSYSGTLKRIAFKDGKLLAFCASDTKETQWWDKGDIYFWGIPFIGKHKGKKGLYVFDEDTGKTSLVREKLSDGAYAMYKNGRKSYELLSDMTVHMYSDDGELIRTFSLDGGEREYYKNGKLKSVKLTDGTKGKFHRNGLLMFAKLADGTAFFFHDNGHLASEELSNGTSRSYYTDGQLQSVRAGGTYQEYYKNGQLKQERLPNRMIREYYENDKLKSITLSDETHFTCYDNGTLETVDFIDGRGFSWGRSGTLSSARMSNDTFLFRDDNGQPKFAGIRLSSGKTRYAAQLSQEQLRELTQDAQSVAQRAKRVKQLIEQYVRENYNQTSTRNSDVYHQIISERAAQRLDEAEETTRRMDALKKAKEWDKFGVPALEIWRNTGWDKGKNGAWKLDLPDGSLKKDLALKAVKKGHLLEAVSTLGEVLDYPELFTAYPELKGRKITFINDGQPDNAPFDYMGFKDHKLNGKPIPAGCFNHNTKEFEIIGDFKFDGTYLKPATNENAILAVLHEVQHAIQDVEGWPAGSSLENAVDSIPEVQKLKTRLNELCEQRASFELNARSSREQLDGILSDTDFDSNTKHLYKVYSGILNEIRELEQEYSELQKKEERLNNLLNAINLTQDDARYFEAELYRVTSNMDAVAEDIQQKNVEADELFSSSQLSDKQKSLARIAANMRENILAKRQQRLDEVNAEIDALKDELSHVVENANDNGTLMSLYVRDAGETEARNVMIRHRMTEQERRDTPLWATEDIPRSEQTETYKQIIGERGAHRLDELEGITKRMDALKQAKEMKGTGKSAGVIWETTGWELAPDGKWRMELQDIPVDLVNIAKNFDKRLEILERKYNVINQEYSVLDGRLRFAKREDVPELRKKRDKLFKQLQALLIDMESVSLGEIFGSNSEIIKAYPILKKFRVKFVPTREEIDGYCDSPNKTIVINDRHVLNNDNYRLREILIHEVQHAIQDIEGFTLGYPPEPFIPLENEYFNLNDKLLNLDVDAGIFGDIQDIDEEFEMGMILQDEAEEKKAELRYSTPYAKEYRKILSHLDELNAFSRKYFNGHTDADSIYMDIGGEVEARNANSRIDFTPEQRKKTLLADTQDTDKWLDPAKTSKAMESFKGIQKTHFITPEQGERFDQLVLTATGNIITNNKFDLRYVGTNTGSSFFGYGAYFGQSKEISERYRHFGKSQEQGNIYIFDIPEDYELMDWHTTLSQQPADVKMKLRRLMNELRRRGYSPQQVFGIPTRITNLSGIKKSSLNPKDITGGALYQNIVNIFLTEEGQTGRFNVEDRAAKVKTSQLFNEFGIPGLRYSDKYELGRKNSSTYNYVVWDMHRVRMEGIDPSSTQEAIEYYERTKEKQGQSGNATEIYNQPFLRAKRLEDEKFMDIEAFTLTTEARRQIDEVRKQYFGTPQWMKAPNGKKSKLSEQQWLAVRTPNFIRWFGDWENDTKNASRVLDENGEPLVVYHGTAKDRVFSVFHTRWQGNGKYQNTHQGAHFGTRKSSIERIVNWYRYLNNLPNYIPDDWEAAARQLGHIMPCFLNIRKLGRVKDQVTDWSKAIDAAIRKGFDGLVYTNSL